MEGVGLTRRRVGQCSVFGVRCSVFEYEHVYDYEHEHEHEESPGEVFVARAFQPEICPLRLDCLEIAARGWGAVGFTRSREDAKGNAQGCCGVF